MTGYKKSKKTLLGANLFGQFCFYTGGTQVRGQAGVDEGHDKYKNTSLARKYN